MRYIVTKLTELRWEVEATSHDEAKAIVDDMGESTGKTTQKTEVVALTGEPWRRKAKTYIG